RAEQFVAGNGRQRGHGAAERRNGRSERKDYSRGSAFPAGEMKKARGCAPRASLRTDVMDHTGAGSSIGVGAGRLVRMWKNTTNTINASITPALGTSQKLCQSITPSGEVYRPLSQPASRLPSHMPTP